MKKSLGFKYVVLIMLVLFLVVLNICIGSARIPFKEAISILVGRGTNSTYKDIIMDIRLPRIVAAFFTGSALALSGYLLQTFFRNPIAGPFILGISSGSKLFVALLLVATGGSIISYFSKILAGLLGAALVVVFVLLCSRKAPNMAVLLVCGVMVGYICNAVTDLTVTFAEDQDIVNLHNWSKDSLSGMSWGETLVIVLSVLVSFICILLMTKPMSAYICGESYAYSLGINIKLFRILLITISSILAAVVTAFIGPVSFVGVAVPHLMRSFVKGAKTRDMVIGCFLLGGAFCLFSDLVARCLFSPLELTLSTVTAIFGAPIVIYLLIKSKGR